MSAPTPPLDLDALARLESRATAGPWRVVLDDSESATTVWQVCTSTDHPARDDSDHMVVYDCCADGGLHGKPWYREADAEFIAALRNAAPELIRLAREADRLRPVVDAARELLDADSETVAQDWARKQLADALDADAPTLPEQVGRVGDPLPPLPDTAYPPGATPLEPADDPPTITIERPDDEHIEIYVNGVVVATADHDEHGWDGMDAVERTAVAIRRALSLGGGESR
jgi:hypothetical protein